MDSTLARRTTITVTRQPAQVCIDGFCIQSAPTVAEMHAVLGQPSRIDAGEKPAPAGHRNNRVHIFDDLGVTFNEHHYTQLAQGITCWFDVEEPPFQFTPKCTFQGQLVFERVTMPLGGDVRAFLAASPYAFTDHFAGTWRYEFEGFSVIVASRGTRLPSGRRSKVRRVTDISLSWPHDNWQPPAGGI
jgi:hypothetical protein